MPSERHQLKIESAHVHQLLCSLCKVRVMILAMMIIIIIIMTTLIMIMFRMVRTVL